MESAPNFFLGSQEAFLEEAHYLSQTLKNGDLERELKKKKKR